MTNTAICFDATGTLIETTEQVGDVYHRVAVEFGVDLPAWRLEDAFGRILRSAPPRGLDGASVEARRQGEVDWWFERIRETFQATDSTARFDDFHAFATALFEAYRAPGAWRCRSGVHDLLARFRREQRRLAVVSNFDHRLPEILENLEIATFFETVVIPSESGSAKPEADCFDAVCRQLTLPREALTYVGDDAVETLQAIASLGIGTIDVREIAGLASLPDHLPASGGPLLSEATGAPPST